MTKGYYVTLKRQTLEGVKTAWLLGPFAEHQKALDAVTETKNKAEEIDPRYFWDAHGTSSITAGPSGVLPPGKLNSILAHLVIDCTP